MAELLGPGLTEYGKTFLMVFLRIGVFMLMLPFFASKSFPTQFKIGLIVSLAVVLTPIVKPVMDTHNILAVIAKEVILGVLLGLCVRTIFMAVNMAGQLMSYSMGMSMATVFDPEYGQSAEIARLLGIIVMLVFFSLDAHHEIIYLFAKSFEILPLGVINIETMLPLGIRFGSMVFIMALKMAAPIMVGMAVASLLFGYMYKAAPQINIFFVSYPVYLFVGFIIIILSMPIFFKFLTISIEQIRTEMYKVLVAAGAK
ncbi:MAG: flagellar biosynthetic protein FliR [Nitrospirae bacterium]|nr:flagellar biosynthetic protein FliR [Nitrospirota bacterium]